MKKKVDRSVVLRVHLMPDQYNKLMDLCSKLCVSPGVIFSGLIDQLDPDRLIDSVRCAGGVVNE